MAKIRRLIWTDYEMLRALDLVSDGLTLAETARTISAEVGRTISKNAMVGLINRIRADMALVDENCHRPENRTGGMPQRWWLDGLRQRRDAR